jgi:hypothetical protein
MPGQFRCRRRSSHWNQPRNGNCTKASRALRPWAACGGAEESIGAPLVIVAGRGIPKSLYREEFQGRGYSFYVPPTVLVGLLLLFQSWFPDCNLRNPRNLRIHSQDSSADYTHCQGCGHLWVNSQINPAPSNPDYLDSSGCLWLGQVHGGFHGWRLNKRPRVRALRPVDGRRARRMWRSGWMGKN